MKTVLSKKARSWIKLHLEPRFDNNLRAREENDLATRHEVKYGQFVATNSYADAVTVLPWQKDVNCRYVENAKISRCRRIHSLCEIRIPSS